MYGVFVVHLIQEELLQLKQLVSLNIFLLLRTAHVIHLLDRWWEFEVDKGVDTVEDALLGSNIYGFMGGFRIDFLSCSGHD